MNEIQPLLAIPALITALTNVRHDSSVLFLGSRLELSQEQETNLCRILGARKPRLVALAVCLRDAHRRMVDHCVCLHSSPEPLHAAQTSVQELTYSLMVEVGQASLEIEAILDAPQLARIALFREEAEARIEGIRTYLSALWPLAQASSSMAGPLPADT